MLEDGGSPWREKIEEENKGKTECDGHVTRWSFVLTPLTDVIGEKWLSLVVECSILVELVVDGASRIFW